MGQDGHPGIGSVGGSGPLGMGCRAAVVIFDADGVLEKSEKDGYAQFGMGFSASRQLCRHTRRVTTIREPMQSLWWYKLWFDPINVLSSTVLFAEWQEADDGRERDLGPGAMQVGLGLRGRVAEDLP